MTITAESADIVAAQDFTDHDSTELVTDAALIGSLCNAPRRAATAVAGHLRADDAATIGGRRVLEVILELLRSGESHGFEAVQLELLRSGDVDGPAKRTLLDAVTAGYSGLEGQLRMIAESVVWQSYVRLHESWAFAHAEAVRTMRPAELMPWAAIQGRAARDHEARITALAGQVAA